MVAIAYFLMILGMVVTVGFLILGIIAMARGGEFNHKWGNKLMRYRIAAQFFSIAMFMLGLVLAKYFS